MNVGCRHCQALKLEASQPPNMQIKKAPVCIMYSRCVRAMIQTSQLLACQQHHSIIQSIIIMMSDTAA
jgi:hypothetical protein